MLGMPYLLLGVGGSLLYRRYRHWGGHVAAGSDQSDPTP